MLKILLTFLVILEIGIAALLILGIIASIKMGGGSILLPGLGLIISMPLLLGVVFIIEMILVAISIILYRYIKNNSGRLA